MGPQSPDKKLTTASTRSFPELRVETESELMMLARKKKFLR